MPLAAVAVCGGLAAVAFGICPGCSSADSGCRRRLRRCSGSCSSAWRPPGCGEAWALRAGIAVACAAVLGCVKQLVRRLGRTRRREGLDSRRRFSRIRSTMRFRNVARVARRRARIRGSRVPLLVESAQPRRRVAAVRRGGAALPARAGRAARAVRRDRPVQGREHVHRSRPALPHGVELWSYDLHVALRPDMPGEQLDAELRSALERYGLDNKVHLVVADSRKVEPPSAELELLFIDGDHSYDGRRADFDRWSALVRPGRAPALPRRRRLAAATATSIRAWRGSPARSSATAAGNGTAAQARSRTSPGV